MLFWLHRLFSFLFTTFAFSPYLSVLLVIPEIMTSFPSFFIVLHNVTISFAISPGSYSLLRSFVPQCSIIRFGSYSRDGLA